MQRVRRYIAKSKENQSSHHSYPHSIYRCIQYTFQQCRTLCFLHTRSQCKSLGIARCKACHKSSHGIFQQCSDCSLRHTHFCRMHRRGLRRCSCNGTPCICLQYRHLDHLSDHLCLRTRFRCRGSLWYRKCYYKDSLCSPPQYRSRYPRQVYFFPRSHARCMRLRSSHRCLCNRIHGCYLDKYLVFQMGC